MQTFQGSQISQKIKIDSNDINAFKSYSSIYSNKIKNFN